MKKKRASSAPRPILEKYRAEISRCVKCGSCRAVCPPFLLAKEESLSARGRMSLIKAVLDGRLTVSDIFEHRLETCTTCLACEATCASNVPVSEIIQAAKEQAVEESGTGIVRKVISGVAKHPALFRAAAWLAPAALHYSEGRRTPCSCETRVQARDEEQGSRGKRQGSKGTIAFFPGCAVEYFQPDIGRATMAVLNRLRYDVIIPEGLKCCGRPLLSLGDRKAAKELAEHNSTLLAGVEADAVVTACASCSLTFKREYPKLLRPGTKTPALLDVHEFLSGELSEASFRLAGRTVTWHYPCHLNRGQGLAKTMSDLIRMIPGITVAEMKNADRCCGFGGVMRMSHRQVSDGIADEKVKNIIATKASTVVTGCPGCRMQIIDGLSRAGSDVEVLHTVQLVEEALR